jgi:hypothetical protein
LKQKQVSNDDADSPTQDSGVQLLDSDDLNDSMISSAVLEFEDTTINTKSSSSNDEATNSSNKSVAVCEVLPDLLAPFATMKNALSRSDIENNNNSNNSNDLMTINPDITSSICVENVDMMSSIHSTFDTENTEIVYRRKIKKQTKSAPKKRVSFHEDILNSTRTDNIHIEHGFITYKGRHQKPSTRYSWCSEYNNEELDARDRDEDEACGHHVYRNACSEVLDYGKTDIQDDDEKETVKNDQSGVFEYPPLNAKRFYRCTCSSSSSIESGSSGENNSSSSDLKSPPSSSSSSTSNNSSTGNQHQNYKQSKSSSCDCIESSNNNNEIGKGTFYCSEPNIGKSVWNKEKKPKSSCLKKKKTMSEKTDIIQEPTMQSSVKKFNLHQLSSSVIKDNGKMIIGSLKDFLGISLPERGVPEGSEEDAPEAQESSQSPRQQQHQHDLSFLNKVGIFNRPENLQKLSKSLDGGFGKQNKKFHHNVDEQLRRANDEDLYAPSNETSRKNSLKTESSVEEKEADENITSSCGNNPQRNKYIINCESTVFEHTGTVEIPQQNLTRDDSQDSFASMHNPFKAKISNILNSIAGNVPANNSNNNKNNNKLDNEDPFIVSTTSTTSSSYANHVDVDEYNNKASSNVMESSIASTLSDRNSSIMSDISSNTTASYDFKIQQRVINETSPKRKTSQAEMSPDLFNRDGDFIYSSNLHARKNKLLDDFDDVLTITATPSTSNAAASSSNAALAGVTDFNDDIVIVDYSDVKNDLENNPSANYYLKLPSIMTSSTSSSKSSLINRFLRNVTQKKILEATIKRNTFFQAKLKNETKLFGGNLYVKGVKPKNDDLIKDMNAEIDLEVEMGCNSLEYEDEMESYENNASASAFAVVGSNNKSNRSSVISNDSNEFNSNAGIGEMRIELFSKKNLRLFRDHSEVMMKAFKLYTGYSNEGNMCAVLVFLTDKTIYVVELVRNELCNKFVLPYAELDVILMGPMGNTVLLSNTARDMQQVLLTCGPYPAEKLISSLEMCARRGGYYLPAVGQLTLDHFAPLHAFVCSNSNVGKSDIWKYYSIVNIPAGCILSMEDEHPLGPTLNGFFMHRNLSHSGVIQKWSAGYFMLKAGVLYLFNDSTHKIPSWAVTLPNECQGARRCTTSNRPHCFEILLRSGSLQLAAPDEYVCSEWLQSVVQAASRCLNDIDEKPKTLGCTLIMTENHLITLREDFSSPLRRITHQQPTILSPSVFASSSQQQQQQQKENIDPNCLMTRKLSSSTIVDTSSEVSSIRSSSSRGGRSNSSTIFSGSTPTKLSRKINYDESKSHTNMTSFYGKNSGIEVLTCASIEELISIKMPNDEESWWCLLVRKAFFVECKIEIDWQLFMISLFLPLLFNFLSQEFSCQEVRENFDDLVLFFTTQSEMQRFLGMLESLWHQKMVNRKLISLSANELLIFNYYFFFHPLSIHLIHHIEMELKI